MSRLKLFISTIILSLPLIFAPAVTVHAQTQNTEKVFAGCDQAPTSPVCQDQAATDDPIVRIINVAAGIIALLVGIGAVIMLIVGGFSFVTAGGNAEQATNARRRIIYSLAGLLVVGLAWAATRFITDRVIQ